MYLYSKFKFFTTYTPTYKLWKSIVCFFPGESYSFQPGIGFIPRKACHIFCHFTVAYWCGCHPRSPVTLEMRQPFCLIFHCGVFQETTVRLWWKKQRVILHKNDLSPLRLSIHTQPTPCFLNTKMGSVTPLVMPQ